MIDELICNGVYLDVSDTIPIPISYAIADIKEPSKRKKSFSKEITLPATMKNNAFFAGVFRYTATESNVNFDATAKAEIILNKRGIQVLKGVLKLNSVVLDGMTPTYKCQIFAESVDIFLLLQNIAVNELDWSAYNHTLNRTNIKNSWTAAVGSGYYYPLIERRPRLGATIWNTTDLIPYVYLREVLVKIFEIVGLTWDSTFLDTTQFKSILFGYGGGSIKTIPASELNNRKILIDNGDLNYSYTVDYGGYIVPTAVDIFEPTTIFSTFTATETQDINNQWVLGETTIQQSGNYQIDVSLILDYVITTGNTYNSFTESALYVRKNGVTIYAITPTTLLSYLLTGTITYDVNASSSMACNSGDIITFTYFSGILNSYTDPNDYTQQSVTLDITTNTPITIYITCTDSVVTDGGTIVLNQFLPNMKCSEFLVNSIRQFNLYISEQDTNAVVKIEPLSNYYQATNVFNDITALIDHDKDTIVTPSANQFNKNILFTFKKQSHTDFTDYLDKWAVEYNDLKQEQGSYYAKGDYKIELTWATLIPYQVATNIYVPRFVKIDNGVLKPNDGAPIICFRNGSKTGSWTFRDTVGTGQEVLTTYPSIHHFDNWASPTMDLSFMLTNELFHDASVVTTTNCYSEYYQDFINEMTSKGGQIVNTYVFWNEIDIRDLDFSKLIMINGALFRLNEVVEFAPESQLSTKIELVKVLKAKARNRKVITKIQPAPMGSVVITNPTTASNDVGVFVGGLSHGNYSSQIIKG
jgi:hypothetical protein